MDSDLRGVVVGVDGSAASWVACEAGVLEAQRFGVPIRLVHVVPNYLPMSPYVPDDPTALTEAGRQILREATGKVTALAPNLVVESELRHGSRAAELARSAARARMLCVGGPVRHGVERAIRGNVVAAVAARATCPLTVVRSEARPTSRGAVLVGMKSPHHATELLAAAFAAADAYGDRLIVLHAWNLPNSYDDIIAARVAHDEWKEHSTKEIDELLRPWRVKYPNVEVEIRIAHAEPARALLTTSGEAVLLVVVRRGHGFPAAMHLGGVARAMLRQAECPVLVVPPGGLNAVAGLVVEHEGTLHARQ